MRWIADFVYLLAGLIYLPVALYNALIVGKNRRGWAERFGAVRVRDPGKPRIWIHAVSLGEVNATPRLVEALRRRLPDHDIVVSTTTDTGFARAVQFYGREHVFRFPLDFSLVISRVLKRIRPSVIVLVELEVWYNLIRMATAREIPVVIVNGRLTERSSRRLAWLGRPARFMFERLTWVGAQDAAIAARFRRLGAPADGVEVTSSMKWDTAEVADPVEGADRLAEVCGLDTGRPIWVCGSTGPGEEAMILDAYRKLLDDGTALARSVQGGQQTATGVEQPVLILVPRKPERFDEVARVIQKAGFTCVRRSERRDDGPVEALPDSAVLLGDTMGELRKFYSLARVVFVGRSLVSMGGSDPMEVAALGKPMIVGPHTDNFELPVRALQEADAIRIVGSVDELPSAAAAMLTGESVAAELGSRARGVVIRHQGATDRTADRIARFVKPGAA